MIRSRIHRALFHWSSHSTIKKSIPNIATFLKVVLPTLNIPAQYTSSGCEQKLNKTYNSDYIEIQILIASHHYYILPFFFASMKTIIWFSQLHQIYTKPFSSRDAMIWIWPP
jgi:hypothetical protein